MSNWERDGMEIPPTVRASVACAVFDVTNGVELNQDLAKILETQYFTEGWYLEAIEAVFEFNDWKLSVDLKKKFKKIFKDRKSTGA